MAKKTVAAKANKPASAMKHKEIQSEPGVLAAKKLDSKLISIRIPENMIDDLRGMAKHKGDMGYQQLIKTYIQSGLSQEAGEESGKFSGRKYSPKKRISNEVSHETLEATKLPAPAARSAASELITSEVISEDIRNLARFLKPYHSFFEGKTFLVTGAFGFLGRYMVLLFKYLNQEVLKRKMKAVLVDNFVTGYEQRIITDDDLRFVRHDVVRPMELDGPVDYLIHAAGIASPVYYTKFPIETMDVGTQGTRQMLEMARQKNVKSFVFMSSSEVYGDPDNRHVPTAETYFGNVSMDGPRSCYDESKRFGETMCQVFWKVYNVPVKVIRPFNVYGPGIRADDYRVLPNFIEHALRREPLPIHGAGHNTRSFCYINDSVEGIFRVLFSDANGEAFNVGNPNPELSVTQLAEKVVAAKAGQVGVLRIDPPHAVYASSDPKRRCPDISKISKVTGYRPRYSLDNGLIRTVKWFQSRYPHS